MPAQQKALIVRYKQGPFVIRAVEIPTPGFGELLVKVESSALNPVDWKIQTRGIFVTEYPAVLGLDAAGMVVGFGRGVSGFTIGDRVFTEGAFDNAHATFQQYILADADITAKVPYKLSLDDAAALPVSVVTAALGLFNRDDPSSSAALFPPWEKGGRGKYAGKPMMIFGGTTSVGQIVIQLTKLSGFSPIIVTASLHNAKLLKSYGATHILDRRMSASELRSAVTDITSLPVKTIYDAVGLRDTQNAAYNILAPSGTLVVVLEDAVDPSKKTPEKKIVRAEGDTYAVENRRTSASLFGQLTSLLERGLIKPNRVEVLSNGLVGIPGGLERLKNNEVSGLKLIVRPQETP
ncbi:chaperonin 10-like protein [Sparassis latifolia]